MIDDVADHLSGLEAAQDAGELIVEPAEEGVHQRLGLGPTDGALVVGWAAADLGLNGVEGGDPLQRLRLDRRGGSGGEVTKSRRA